MVSTDSREKEELMESDVCNAMVQGKVMQLKSDKSPGPKNVYQVVQYEMALDKCW